MSEGNDKDARTQRLSDRDDDRVRAPESGDEATRVLQPDKGGHAEAGDSDATRVVNQRGEPGEEKTRVVSRDDDRTRRLDDDRASDEAVGDTQRLPLDTARRASDADTDDADSDRTRVLDDRDGSATGSGPDQTELLDDPGEPQSKKSRSARSDATEAMPNSPGKSGPAASKPLPGDSTQGGGKSSGLSLSVGSVLRNRFRITGMLGEGGMGAVFSAVDMLKEEAKDENVDVALKVMKADIVDASMSFMGLQREARRAQQLAHPNIVTVYDFDRADGVIYMTMEYLRGKPLDAILDEHPHGLDLETARDITTQICKGLAYAHKEGIVHADLKPQNVFVLDSGRAKVLDFGIARAYQAKKVDLVESVFSGYSPPYASPEVMARKSPTPSDDVYALGCVVYQLFTGRHPFDWTPAPKAREQGLKPARDGSFKRAEWAAVQSALNFDGSKRPADAAEFLKRFAPSRVRRVGLAVSLASLIAAASFMYFYSPEPGPDTPFEELPQQLQQQITRNLGDAERFMSFGDLDSAFQLYDAVLTAHPGNLAATEGIDQAAREAISLVRDAVGRGETTPEAARRTLESIRGYETLPSRSRRAIDLAIEQL